MDRTPTLPVDGLDFRDLGEPAQRIAIYAMLVRINSNTEQIMKDASREAGETRESFAQLKDAVSGSIGRLMDKINTLTAENASLKQQVADANETVVDASEAAAISDQTQKDMQAEADELAKVGIEIEVPPPNPPLDNGETPAGQ